MGVEAKNNDVIIMLDNDENKHIRLSNKFAVFYENGKASIVHIPFMDYKLYETLQDLIRYLEIFEKERGDNDE